MDNIVIKRKLVRRLDKLPAVVQDLFFELVDDLRSAGPVQAGWPNYSRLNLREYHCHLKYRYVACWRHKKIP